MYQSNLSYKQTGNCLTVSVQINLLFHHSDALILLRQLVTPIAAGFYRERLKYFATNNCQTVYYILFG